jgi:uncharacterized protein YlxW (UPF0749 family)
VHHKAKEANDWKYNYIREKETEHKLAVENTLLNSHVSTLNREVTRKTIEANDWKNIATSPPRKRYYY